MKTARNFKSATSVKIENVRSIWLLCLGVVLMTLSHLTWNVDMLAWVSMIPFLWFLNITKGWKSRLAFILFLILAWSLTVLKIISEPIPYFLIPMYSIPIALIHLPGYILYDRVKSHKLSLLVFPAMMITMEWIQYTFTPFASWGIAAYTQADSINIIQSVSLFGVAGLGFLIYWTNAAFINVIITKKRTLLNFYLPIIMILAIVIFGNLRLDISNTTGKETIKVAAIGTDSEIGGLPLPEFTSNTEDIAAIFKRTSKAADLGAKLIVWTEAAFYLTTEKEQAWKDSISNLAKSLEVGITASYVVPISESPFRYENKYVLFDSDGEIRNEYQKHEPVPGEPAVKGTEEIFAVNLFGSEVGGAICYDYDFPYLAKENMRSNVDIVSLPSSDWRGIDPLHTKMACFRAIEQGHSIVRSTRFGLSASINHHGEMLAKMSSYDKNDKILISDIPAKRIRTVYSVIGDIFIYVNMGFLLLILFQILRVGIVNRNHDQKVPRPNAILGRS